MSSSSNVGSRNIYGDGDQRTYKESEIKEAERYKEARPNSHLETYERDHTVANMLAREEKRYHEPDQKELDKMRLEKDATLPAKAHGNKPSRGAEIDQELREEEAEIIKKKDEKREAEGERKK